jgi:hypothetical protein
VKLTALSIFFVLMVIILLSMWSVKPAPAQVEGPGPYIGVNRSGFALAWIVTQKGRVICRSPFVDTRNRRIECD